MQGLKKVILTGTTSGIGRATAELFLAKGHIVYGLDIQPPTIEHERYIHIQCDVGDADSLPEIRNADIIINNAGTIEEEDAVRTNLIGYVNVGEKYAFSPCVESVVNVGSISGRVGLDYPFYSASQGGRIAYTKNLAIRLGKFNKAKVNCVSFGAVHSGLEPKLYKEQQLMNAVANESILKKWITPSEAAEWVYFVAVHNKSMTGQDILIDNGEEANYNFIDSREEQP